MRRAEDGDRTKRALGFENEHRVDDENSDGCGFVTF